MTMNPVSHSPPKWFFETSRAKKVKKRIKELIPGGTGCGIVSPSQSSFGEPFNAAGGGVFGMLWDGTGIRMCESSPSLTLLSSLFFLHLFRLPTFHFILVLPRSSGSL